MKKIIAGALSLLIGMSAGSLAWGALNGSSTTISTSTLCNNGTIEKSFAGAFTTTCGAGWLVGELGTPVAPTFTTLLDFDDGDGQAWTGWTYDANASQFGDEGWLWTDSSGFWGPCINSGSYCLPVSFGKSSVATAIIDTTQRAPSTSTGGSLYVTESDEDQQADWWLIQAGKNFGDYGIADASTDRMSFYLKLEGMNVTNPADPVDQNFHVGTYLCWDSYCPGEAPNQHYYHWLAIGLNDAWIHVQIDQHPQHIRGRSNSHPQMVNNQPFIEYGKNYFDSMVQVYLAMEGSPQTGTTAFTVDEFEFFNQPEEQNEESIVSVWVGYSESQDFWEIGWHDTSFQAYNADSFSTFEIRYSTAPITNANWLSATPIVAQYWAGTEYTGTTATNIIRRNNSWRQTVWTRFALADSIEAANDKLYFAMKDVSSASGNQGTDSLYNFPDGHNAPSSLIKTIDYSLRAN